MPVFAMQEDFFLRSLANENIHYDVDENLWPNKNIEVQGNTPVDILL